MSKPRRTGKPEYAVMAFVMATALGAPAPVDAGWSWMGSHAAAVGGYDSNVARASNSSGGADGDARIALFGSLAGQHRRGALRSAVDIRPYLTSYTGLNDFDRGEFFASASTRWQPARRWNIVLKDRFRYTNFLGRDFDRTLNTFQPQIVFSHPGGLRASLHYRYLVRTNPRRSIRNSHANGVGASATYSFTPRLSAAAMIRYDGQSVNFVFPRSVDGRRLWIDASARYLLGKKTLVLGKYLFQSDEMDILFSPGANFDRLGDSADDFAEGIAQSFRFLEDSDYNFDKHLFVLSTHTSVREGFFADGFLLYQHKRFEQRVVALAGRPERRDNTFVAQVGGQYRLGDRFSLIGSVRYERNGSNDPRTDYSYLITGIGVKRTF